MLASQFTLLDFETAEVPDADWLLEFPQGTAAAHVQAKGDSGANVFSIAPDAGRNGSQALLVESLDAGMGLPGFWVKQGIQNGGWVGQSNSDQGYFLPRGMQANRLEFWVRFEDGFRSEYAADPDIYRTMDVGTYHYNPGKNSSRVVESDNWHFYHKLVLRHDQAGDDWIHVVLNESPQDQRSGSGGVTLNPTSPAGNYWELLTRFYVDLSPYFSDPEIGYPAKMWIDDIQLSYVEEPELVEVTFGDSVDGQTLIAETEVVRDLDVSVTNLSSSTTTGYLKKHAHWRLFSEVFDTQTGEA
ncbi:MAG: hypothetical protein P8N76_17155, partial [Pirellulaceae bacterium]|nr:hypothetical protein [Pirellulaceae bacterium]